MNNALMVIFPYQHKGTWVFDDADFNLIKEPFVFGVPEMIEELVSHMPNAPDGFKLIFSQNPFPGYQRKLSWLREEYEGNWYTIDGSNEGWLCPALFKYFEAAPKEIFVKAENT